MINLHKWNKGFTLIELIIVIAIMGLVAMLIYPLHLFGEKSFKKGENKADVQFDARMALDYITKEVRYAFDVEILSDTSLIPGSVYDDNCYIYMKDNGTSQDIICKDKSGDRTVASFNTSNLTFSTTDNKVLQYDLTGTDQGESITLYSDVVPLNMPKGNIIINNNGKVVRYIKSSSSPITFDTTYSFNVHKGSSFEHTFTITGGTAPYTYELFSGTLPPGISLDSDNSKLSGIPTVADSYTFTVKLTDSSVPSLVAYKEFHILVIDDSLPVVPGNQPPKAADVTVKVGGVVKNEAIKGETLSVTYTYSDAENDTQSGVTYRWIRIVKDNRNNDQLIEVGTGSTYTVQEADKNTKIYVEVTPTATAGTIIGDTTVSLSITIKNN